MQPTTRPSSFYSIPTAINQWVAYAIIAFHGLVLLALPLWLLPQSLLWGWLLVPLFWVHSTHWALIHEAIHKLAIEDMTQNEAWGRLLSVLMGASFHVLRFGHLTHHQLNRDWHSEYVQTPTLQNQLSYYSTLLFGLYLTEVVCSILLAVLPRAAFTQLARTHFLREYPEVATTGERYFYTRGHIAAVREDAVVIILLYAAAFWLYGAYWPVLAGFIALRALVISVMDNIYHYGTPADNSRASKELHLPIAVSRLILCSNYHETHHLNPRLPWTALHAANQESRRGYDGPLMAHGLVQFAGPLAHHPASPDARYSKQRWQAAMGQTT